MDTMTAGATIAFAMECYEKGFIDQNDTGGLAIKWGEKELLIELVHLIGRNEGFGKMLALGSRKLAWKIGHDSIDFTVQSKGLELPMHDQRAFFGWAANYATSPRGACHLHGMSSFFEEKQAPLPEWGLTGFYPRQSDENKGKVARLAQNWGALVGSLVLCYFASFPLKPSDLAALVNYSTGTEYTPQDMLVIGDRINALYRAYNYRCGVRRADDTLTRRALMPLPDGGAAGKSPNLDYQLAEYYHERQWEPDGKPSRSSLIELGLEDAVQDLFAAST
jgi:aldehyde:ferredoxin oxidoreductase